MTFISFFGTLSLLGGASSLVATTSFVSPQRRTLFSPSKQPDDGRKVISITTAATVTTNEQESMVDEEQQSTILTSAVFNITYDGSHFHGWSAANDNLPNEKQEEEEEDDDDVNTPSNGADFLPPLNINRRGGGKSRRRKRGKRIPGISQIRSAEGVVKKCLAKVYGNVDPARIQVEGCSRTDKGVHARSMIAQIYCLTEEAASLYISAANKEKRENHNKTTISIKKEECGDEDGVSSSIPGKRMPHPISPTDASSFLPLPFNSNLGKMMFVLNRMFPPDLRVSAVSKTPTKTENLPKTESDDNDESSSAFIGVPFHPSLDAISKTYLYTFSIGDMHDPMRWRHVWHVEGHYGAGKEFDFKLARKTADILVGKHDYRAFRGAFQGSERGRVQDTVCTLSEINIEKEGNNNLVDDVSLPLPEYVVGGKGEKEASGGSTIKPLTTYTISVTGDRFLYKMVRFLVGTIVAVGHGKISIDDVEYALENGSWEVEKEGDKGKKQHICAPAHGLVLKDVHYDDKIEFEWTGSNRWSVLSRQEKNSWES